MFVERWQGALPEPLTDEDRQRGYGHALAVRPHRKPGQELSERQAVVIEKPRWNLTIFKVHFGLLDAEGVHQRRTRPAFRGDRSSHQAARLRSQTGQVPQITTRLTGMVDRFMSMLDCVEIGFLPDGILDQLPAPSKLSATRTGGLDMNLPRVRAALAAALALAVAPTGFTVAEFTAKVRAMTGQTPEDYSVRQGAYDLRKLRGKQLVIKPGRTRRYHVPERRRANDQRAADPPRQSHRALTAGIRIPRRGRPPNNWTNIDRDYETLRRQVQTLSSATACPR